jgi:hypothetical protein
MDDELVFFFWRGAGAGGEGSTGTRTGQPKKRRRIGLEMAGVFFTT